MARRRKYYTDLAVCIVQICLMAGMIAARPLAFKKGKLKFKSYIYDPL